MTRLSDSQNLKPGAKNWLNPYTVPDIFYIPLLNPMLSKGIQVCPDAVDTLLAIVAHHCCVILKLLPWFYPALFGFPVLPLSHRYLKDTLSLVLAWPVPEVQVKPHLCSYLSPQPWLLLDLFITAAESSTVFPCQGIFKPCPSWDLDLWHSSMPVGFSGPWIAPWRISEIQTAEWIGVLHP